MKEYEPYVKSLAKRFEFYKSKEDLYQAGFMGLVMAYKNFDPRFDVKFSTYAYSYILGEMKKVINDNTLKYGKQLLSLKYKIDKVSILLTQKLMRLPTKEEIIKILNITEYEYDEVMQINNPVSLDKVVGEDLALYEVIGDREKDIALLVALKQELQNLNKEEKELINSRYVYGETQREVADLLNTNQVDVSRKEKKILLKLKTRLKS
ncbi:MAG: sigma-70 family RNA polymerase sigma factor [Firmicutes bacterium]|nr:sigma-70 family RNA polymerase sigma factor [Bacillota bacterium]